MSLGHIHLMLNHVPMLGVVFGILVLLNAHFRKSHDLMRVALKMFVLAAVMTVPVFFTGDYAASDIRNLASFSKDLSNAHENTAVFAYIAVGILGVVALWGLWTVYRKKTLPKRFTALILVWSVITFGTFVYTAQSGGLINHPELRPGFVAPPHEDDGD